MNISPVSNHFSFSTQNNTQNTQIKELEEQKKQLEEQIQNIKESKTDEKTKQSQIKDLQSQVEQIESEITQKRTQPASTDKNSDTSAQQAASSPYGRDSFVISDMSNLLKANTTYTKAKTLRNLSVRAKDEKNLMLSNAARDAGSAPVVAASEYKQASKLQSAQNHMNSNLSSSLGAVESTLKTAQSKKAEPSEATNPSGSDTDNLNGEDTAVKQSESEND